MIQLKFLPLKKYSPEREKTDMLPFTKTVMVNLWQVSQGVD